MIIQASKNCKRYRVGREDLIAIESKAESAGKGFEFVAENHGDMEWTVYPMEADAETLEMLAEADKRAEYKLMERVAAMDEQPSPTNQEPPRKSFAARHPNLPLVLAICALIGSIIAPLLR